MLTIFLELLITGSQEDHTELRALKITYMSHNADQFSSYLKEDESMSQYLKRSKMNTLTVWASEIEIIAELQTSIFAYVSSGGKHMWLKHAPIKNIVNSISQHCQEAIYLTIKSCKRME